MAGKIASKWRKAVAYRGRPMSRWDSVSFVAGFGTGQDPLALVKRMADTRNRLGPIWRNVQRADHDVRKSFFAKMLTTYEILYYQIASLVAADYYLSSDFGETDEEAAAFNFVRNLKPTKKNIGRIVNIINAAKLAFVNSCWICFESSIDPLFRAIVPAEEQAAIEQKQLMAAKKILGTSLTIDAERKLSKLLANKHPSINDRWNSLYSLTKNFPGGKDSIREDRNFLEFFGTCRNCMHHNSVSGKSASYHVKIGAFKFEEGKTASFGTPTVVLDMFDELWNVFDRIARSLDHNGIVVDPALDEVAEQLLAVRQVFAYSQWELRGKPAGDDWADWFAAVDAIPVG